MRKGPCCIDLHYTHTRVACYNSKVSYKNGPSIKSSIYSSKYSSSFSSPICLSRILINSDIVLGDISRSEKRALFSRKIDERETERKKKLYNFILRLQQMKESFSTIGDLTVNLDHEMEKSISKTKGVPVLNPPFPIPRSLCERRYIHNDLWEDVQLWKRSKRMMIKAIPVHIPVLATKNCDEDECFQPVVHHEPHKTSPVKIYTKSSNSSSSTCWRIGKNLSRGSQTGKGRRIERQHDFWKRKQERLLRKIVGYDVMKELEKEKQMLKEKNEVPLSRRLPLHSSTDGSIIKKPFWASERFNGDTSINQVTDRALNKVQVLSDIESLAKLVLMSPDHGNIISSLTPDDKSNHGLNNASIIESNVTNEILRMSKGFEALHLDSCGVVGYEEFPVIWSSLPMIRPNSLGILYPSTLKNGPEEGTKDYSSEHNRNSDVCSQCSYPTVLTAVPSGRANVVRNDELGSVRTAAVIRSRRHELGEGQWFSRCDTPKYFTESVPISLRAHASHVVVDAERSISTSSVTTKDDPLSLRITTGIKKPSYLEDIAFELCSTTITVVSQVALYIPSPHTLNCFVEDGQKEKRPYIDTSKQDLLPFENVSNLSGDSKYRSHPSGIRVIGRSLDRGTKHNISEALVQQTLSIKTEWGPLLQWVLKHLNDQESHNDADTLDQSLNKYRASVFFSIASAAAFGLLAPPSIELPSIHHNTHNYHRNPIYKGWLSASKAGLSSVLDGTWKGIPVDRVCMRLANTLIPDRANTQAQIAIGRATLNANFLFTAALCIEVWGALSHSAKHITKLRCERNMENTTVGVCNEFQLGKGQIGNVVDSKTIPNRFVGCYNMDNSHSKAQGGDCTFSSEFHAPHPASTEESVCFISHKKTRQLLEMILPSAFCSESTIDTYASDLDTPSSFPGIYPCTYTRTSNNSLKSNFSKLKWYHFIPSKRRRVYDSLPVGRVNISSGNVFCNTSTKMFGKQKGDLTGALNMSPLNAPAYFCHNRIAKDPSVECLTKEEHHRTLKGEDFSMNNAQFCRNIGASPKSYYKTFESKAASSHQSNYFSRRPILNLLTSHNLNKKSKQDSSQSYKVSDRIRYEGILEREAQRRCQEFTVEKLVCLQQVMDLGGHLSMTNSLSERDNLLKDIDYMREWLRHFDWREPPVDNYRSYQHYDKISSYASKNSSVMASPLDIQRAVRVRFSVEVSAKVPKYLLSSENQGHIKVQKQCNIHNPSLCLSEKMSYTEAKSFRAQKDLTDECTQQELIQSFSRRLDQTAENEEWANNLMAQFDNVWRTVSMSMFKRCNKEEST